MSKKGTKAIDSILDQARELVKLFKLPLTIHVANNHIITVTYGSTIEKAESLYSIANAQALLEHIQQHTNRLQKQWLAEYDKFRIIANFYGYSVVYKPHQVLLTKSGQEAPLSFGYFAEDVRRLGQFLNFN